ncbi:hypothetical protein LguiA_022745 [Lonicera macranthoides]
MPGDSVLNILMQKLIDFDGFESVFVNNKSTNKSSPQGSINGKAMHAIKATRKFNHFNPPQLRSASGLPPPPPPGKQVHDIKMHAKTYMFGLGNIR